MSWELLRSLTPSFDEQIIPGFFLGNETIRVDHSFNGSTFPGLAYAIISNFFVNNERSFIRRSYPVKDFSRVYQIQVPENLLNSGYILYQLTVRKDVRARVTTTANWVISIYRWIEDTASEPLIDGDFFGNEPLDIFDGDL